MSLALFVALPASVALAVLGEPLVVMLFQRESSTRSRRPRRPGRSPGKGGPSGRWPPFARRSRSFYALGDTRTPVIVSALDLLAFIALAFLLKGPMGHVGISMAVAGSSFVQMALLLVALKRRLGFVAGDAILRVGRAHLPRLRGRRRRGVGGRPPPRAARARRGGRAARAGLVAVAVFGALFLLAAWAPALPSSNRLCDQCAAG